MQPNSIIQKIVGNTKIYKSEACQWGLNKECVAIRLYEEALNVNVESCGLIINPKWPWLGASADGVLEVNGNLRAIEVKCPFSKKENTIGEACNDSSFYLYNVNVNEEIKLKETHPYFYQWQGVMAILGLQELDFIVYTLKDHHIEKITFQNERWYNNILPELTDFYFDFVKYVIFRV